MLQVTRVIEIPGHSRLCSEGAAASSVWRGDTPDVLMHAHGVRWTRRNAEACVGLGAAPGEGQDGAVHSRSGCGPIPAFASFHGWLGRPRFKWRYALRRAHLVLRDATSTVGGCGTS